MLADSREKRILAQRKQDDSDEPKVESYEARREKQKESKIGEGIGDLVISGVDALSAGASKTKEALKSFWKDISTPRYERKK
jgi:hypothetical protein